MQFPLLDELKVAALLAAVWASGASCRRVGVAPLLGQVVAGVLLGPALADVVPHSEAFRVLGKLGGACVRSRCGLRRLTPTRRRPRAVLALVVDSALSVDVAEVKRVGSRALFMAATGVVCPVVLALAFMVATGDGWKAGLAAGAALAPTSLGFSAQLLADMKYLQSSAGQLICTAAVADDVLSLCLMSEVLGGLAQRQRGRDHC